MRREVDNINNCVLLRKRERNEHINGMTNDRLLKITSDTSLVERRLIGRPVNKGMMNRTSKCLNEKKNEEEEYVFILFPLKIHVIVNMNFVKCNENSTPFISAFILEKKMFAI